jgi:glutathionyl-hydroquinone reductase
MPQTSVFASPVDPARFGDYRVPRREGDSRPLYRFTGRITADGASGFAAEPGRYHLYAGWFCPWSQRATIQRALNGLEDVVSVSYVDNARDGRGWAFREQYGPDPVNGFRLLREAYEATEPGFDGHISVPTLWDRATERVVSNDFRTIGIDLATQFGRFGNGTDTYPADLRDRIESVDGWLGPAVNQGVSRAATDFEARAELLDAFEALEDGLTERRYLLGNRLTEADVRLWVSLVRFDVLANAERRIVPDGLAAFPELWRYARELYALPAFSSTTDFDAFTAAGAVRPDWAAPHDRDVVGTSAG